MLDSCLLYASLRNILHLRKCSKNLVDPDWNIEVAKIYAISLMQGQ